MSREQFLTRKYLVLSCLLLLNNKIMITIKNKIMLHTILDAIFFVLIMYEFWSFFANGNTGVPPSDILNTNIFVKIFSVT